MAYADKLIEQVFNEYLTNLHTSMPCEVIAYYPNERKADLQPLFQRIKGGETKNYPMINKAPVSRHVVQCPNDDCICCYCGEPCHCKRDLRSGDIVFASFAERALDFVGNRRHDLTDAVVISRLS